MKTKLFVFGNGFDLGHYLDTRYTDLRDYLEKKDPEFLSVMEELYEVPQQIEDRFGRLIDNSDKERNFWWSKFEEHLGNRYRTYDEKRESFDEGSESFDEKIEPFYEETGDFYFDTYHDFITGMYADDIADALVNADGEAICDGDTLRDIVENELAKYYNFMEKLKELTTEWVRTIDIDLVKKKTDKIAKKNKDSLYLTFNYTKVLEKVYEINSKDICHMHGDADSNDVIIGHGNKSGLLHDRRESELLSGGNGKRAAVIYTNYRIYKSTFKDTSSIISAHASVFASYKDVKEVHIVGLSIGDVDKPYFEEIKNVIRPDADWYCYYYCSDKKEAPQKENETRNNLSFLDLDEDKLHIVDADEFWNL